MKCENHGENVIFCTACRRSHKGFERAQVAAGKWAYAIFQWREDGIYRREYALLGGKLYKRERAAENMAQRLANNTVVRLVALSSEDRKV